MTAKKVNMRHDKIHKATAELGYCCPYAYFVLNSTKHDTNKRLANRLGMTESAMEFNKNKLRKGLLKCEGQQGCKLKDLPTEES